VVIPKNENATEEWCFLYSPCRDVINRTDRGMRVVRQSPASENVNMKAEDIVGIRHQAMTGDETAD
jgi:hypothetical protein